MFVLRHGIGLTQVLLNFFSELIFGEAVKRNLLPADLPRYGDTVCRGSLLSRVSWGSGRGARQRAVALPGPPGADASELCRRSEESRERKKKGIWVDKAARKPPRSPWPQPPGPSEHRHGGHVGGGGGVGGKLLAPVFPASLQTLCSFPSKKQTVH